jgi:hypothetical protein
VLTVQFAAEVFLPIWRHRVQGERLADVLCHRLIGAFSFLFHTYVSTFKGFVHGFLETHYHFSIRELRAEGESLLEKYDFCFVIAGCCLPRGYDKLQKR